MNELGFVAKPNVILISLDTLRADHLGCYGYERNTSPNIDTFAKSSYLFEQAIAPSSWTLPSHVSVFTGLPPAKHGVTFMHGPPPISPEIEILPELALNLGYKTGAFTEGGYVSSIYGFNQGFEVYEENNALTDPDGIGIDKTYDLAEDWLLTLDENPFLLFLHSYEIHSPYKPPSKYLTQVGSDPNAEVGGIGTRFDVSHTKNRYSALAATEEERTRIIELYDGEIAYADDRLGQFFDKLRELKMYDNSLIIIFSDHGEEFWDHGGVDHGYTLYDEVLHVPLIIKLPTQAKKSGRISEQVGLSDIYSTVKQALQPDSPSTEDSLSLYPLMTGVGQYSRPYVISEVGHRAKVMGFVPELPIDRTYRTSDEKYFVRSSEPNELLFDLVNDPVERNNIAESNPEKLDFYQTFFTTYLADIEKNKKDISEPGVETEDLTEEQQEQLKALGYIE